MNCSHDIESVAGGEIDVHGHNIKPNATPTCRILMTWRKDLVHFNKTRDNHIGRLGAHHDVTVLVRRSACLEKHLNSSGTRFVHAPVDKLIPFYRWARAWAIAEHKKQPFDIVFVPVGEEPAGHMIWKKLPAALLAFDLWDVPGIFALSIHSPKRLVAPLYRAAIRHAVQDADFVAVTGRRDAYDHLISANTPCLELSNGVDVSRYAVAAEDNSWWLRDADRLRLVYVGIMNEYRGCIDLVHATAKAHAAGVPVELVMVGPRAASIRSKVDGITRNAPIRVMDPIDSCRIPGLLKSASVGCSPLWDIKKYRSSFPIKVNEYLASGLPVLASDTPGHRTAIPNICGRFFAPRDVGALSSAIADMYSNRQWRSDAGKAAIDVAASRDWNIVVKSLAEGLGDLIRHKFAPR